MSLLSLSFLLFFIAVLLLYYLVPKRWQWVVLLFAGLVFYFCSATPYTFVYVAVSIITIYIATRKIDDISNQIDNQDNRILIEKLIKKKKRVYVCAIAVCMGMLAALKYMNFVLGNIRLVAGIFDKAEFVPEVHWIAALGISFYTLQMVGYLTDVYWGICKSQKNIAKLALLNCYFPQLISGPIGRYGEMETSLYGEHTFEWERIGKGFLRILLGFSKKLIISEHLMPVTTILFSNYTEYEGIFVWIGTALYVIEIYADFSGCMDIIMGVSECFGVKLPENFATPFCSTTIQEFWQRWHITLGAWLKDYIMYPILRSKLWGKYTKSVKNKWGKQAAKQLPTFTAMFVLWFGMGLWHGGDWNYIGEGVWFWLVIVLGQVFAKQLKSLTEWLKINTDSKGWYAFRCTRTAFIYAVGALFFKANDLNAALYMLRTAFSPIDVFNTIEQIVPTIISLDNNVGTMRIGWTAISVLSGLIFQVVLGKMERNGCSFREWLSKQNVGAKLLVIYVLVFAILILGAYGPGYNSSEFIYGGF